MITPQQAKQKIEDYTEGKVFTVTFVKRTNGETRVMNCRKGVRKGVTGEGLKYDPKTKNLVTVYDMQKGAFRMIALESIRRVAMEGQVFDVE
jgi:hypothetical protein